MGKPENGEFGMGASHLRMAGPAPLLSCLFSVSALAKRAIRQNPAAAGSAIVAKVFGALR
jgi:hypothetical protein